MAGKTFANQLFVVNIGKLLFSLNVLILTVWEHKKRICRASQQTTNFQKSREGESETSSTLQHVINFYDV
jgi:hypothetical protein